MPFSCFKSTTYRRSSQPSAGARQVVRIWSLPAGSETTDTGSPKSVSFPKNFCWGPLTQFDGGSDNLLFRVATSVFIESTDDRARIRSPKVTVHPSVVGTFRRPYPKSTGP